MKYSKEPKSLSKALTYAVQEIHKGYSSDIIIIMEKSTNKPEKTKLTF